MHEKLEEGRVRGKWICSEGRKSGRSKKEHLLGPQRVSEGARLGHEE